VPIQNLNPDVLMMKPTEDWYSSDAADLLPSPELCSILSNDRCVRTSLSYERKP
jgi:hypothetical protein